MVLAFSCCGNNAASAVADPIDRPKGAKTEDPTTKEEDLSESESRPKLLNKTQSSARRRRWSTLEPVDISIKYDTERVRNQDIATADLRTFDMYVEEIKTSVRPDTSTPFEPKVWEHIREALGHAHALGFSPSQEPNSFQVKSTEESMKVVTNWDHFRWLMPIYPNEIAEKTGLPLNTVIAELLYASSVGMMDVVWSAECVNCGAGTTAESSLADLANEQVCNLCQYRNRTDALDRVKVYFNWNPDVFYFPVNNFECPTNPELPRMKNIKFLGLALPTTNNSGFSYLFGSKSPKSKPALPAGTYRVACSYTMVDCDIVVERDATTEDTPIRRLLRVSDMVRPKIGASRRVHKIPHGKVRFDLQADTGAFFCFILHDSMDDETMYHHPERIPRDPYTTASELVHSPCFKSLYGDQVVSEASRFTIKNVVLVFTDVVSSTALYSECGDGPALQTVKEHFRILFAAFAQKGRIVKTVGDAVMGAFTTGEAAILAVANALDALEGNLIRPSGSPLRIRVGIHRGPALMVPLNGINDYFGSTVNIAARVESKATDGECLVSESVLEDPHAKAALEKLWEEGYGHTRDAELDLKGVKHRVRARGFQSKNAL